jgi:uncharacterized protein
MVNVNKNNTINYIELPMVKNAETKKFYHQAFEWEFKDLWPDYISFSGANIDGGFNGMGDAQISNPGILVVLYASDLDKKLEEVIQAGGEILKPFYEFPDGKRFHFLDPKWE